MATSAPLAVVWGNCQAEPLAKFLAKPLALQGICVVPVPPVYVITAEELARVHQAVERCSLLITQPVRSGYRMPGTGWEELADLAPADARVISYPVAYDSTEFPFQIVGHRSTGLGSFAPLTAYHDIRMVVGAERGWDVEKVLDWLPVAADAAALRSVARHSLAEMQRRETTLDVTVSASFGRPGAMFTVNHPTNSVLTHVAEGVLAALGVPQPVEIPAHEELEHTTTALEPSVLAAHGWSPALARGWSVGGEPLDPAEITSRHLELLKSRPELGIDSRMRYAWQFELLGF